MLTEKDLAEFKNALISLIEELEQDIADNEEATKPVTLDQTAVGRVSRIDAIQQQQMQLATQERKKSRLAAANAALARIDAGEYGDCRLCEEPIDPSRLRARPETAVCLSCARRSS